MFILAVGSRRKGQKCLRSTVPNCGFKTSSHVHEQWNTGIYVITTAFCFFTLHIDSHYLLCRVLAGIITPFGNLAEGLGGTFDHVLMILALSWSRLPCFCSSCAHVHYLLLSFVLLPFLEVLLPSFLFLFFIFIFLPPSTPLLPPLANLCSTTLGTYLEPFCGVCIIMQGSIHHVNPR